jgi:tRNA(Ile)-lysidine synthase
LEDAEQAVVCERGDGYALFDLESFGQIHESLRWGLLYQSIQRLSSNRKDVDYEAVSRAVSLFSTVIDGSVDLVGETEAFRFHKLGLIRKKNARVMFRDFPQMTTAQPIPVEIGKIVAMNEFWHLTSSLVGILSIDVDLVRKNEDPYVAYFSADELSYPLVLHSYKHGDRFLPFGMDGSVKVSDFFTNKKIPKLAREFWPLLREKDEILWVMGLRRSNLFPIGEGTSEVAVFRIIPLREKDETKTKPLD